MGIKITQVLLCKRKPQSSFNLKEVTFIDGDLGDIEFSLIERVSAKDLKDFVSTYNEFD